MVTIQRELRGYILHVYGPVKKRGQPSLMISGRSPVYGSYGLRKSKPKGCCAWCRTPLDPGQHPRANFHPNCAPWLSIAKGQRTTASGDWVVPRAPCSTCGAHGIELDHRTPIGLAALQSPRCYARAFLPSNLQWLCSPCHRYKTREDIRLIADTKAGRIRMVLHPDFGLDED